MSRCKICGEPVPHRSVLSKRGKHLECSAAVQRAEIMELIEHRGPHFEHWRRRTLQAFGIGLLDDANPAE